MNETRPTCETCKFFDPKFLDPEVGETRGVCRRYPPWNDSSDLPIVESSFWCGDHSAEIPHETKEVLATIAFQAKALQDIIDAITKGFEVVDQTIAKAPITRPATAESISPAEKSAVVNSAKEVLAELKADPNGPTDAEVRAAGIFGEEPVTNAEVPTVGELHAEATRAKAVNAAAFSQTVLDVLKRNSVRKIPDLDDDGRVELYLALRTITDEA